MRIGFHAGANPVANLSTDDYVGTRRVLGLPDGTATIGRIFPDEFAITPNTDQFRLINRAEADCGPVLAAGMWPFLSIHPNIAALLDGHLDQHLKTLGKWIGTLHTIAYLTLWPNPERNDRVARPDTDYTDLRYRAQTFVAAHRHAYTVLKEHAGDRLRIGPCYRADDWRAGSRGIGPGRCAESWRVPEHAADFYGVAVYTNNRNQDDGLGLRRNQAFQRWLRMIDPPRSGVLVAERGIDPRDLDVEEPYTAQADILTDDYQYLSSHLRAHGLIYWNGIGSPAKFDYQLDNAGTRAFRRIAELAAAPPADVAADYQRGYDDGFTAGRMAAHREQAAASQAPRLAGPGS